MFHKMLLIPNTYLILIVSLIRFIACLDWLRTIPVCLVLYIWTLLNTLLCFIRLHWSNYGNLQTSIPDKSNSIVAEIGHFKSCPASLETFWLSPLWGYLEVPDWRLWGQGHAWHNGWPCLTPGKLPWKGVIIHGGTWRTLRVSDQGHGGQDGMGGPQWSYPETFMEISLFLA